MPTTVPTNPITSFCSLRIVTPSLTLFDLGLGLLTLWPQQTQPSNIFPEQGEIIWQMYKRRMF
jgi:hypothetical protein